MTNPEKQPEITPEMIKAGVRVWLEFDRDYDDPESLVVDVYSRMQELAGQAHHALLKSPN